VPFCHKLLESPEFSYPVWGSFSSDALIQNSTASKLLHGHHHSDELVYLDGV
jgi:hypothetical protein